MKKQIIVSLVLVMAGMLFIACPNPVVDPVSYQLSVATTGSG
jgi:uncharacterized Tic20 family protein